MLLLNLDILLFFNGILTPSMHGAVDFMKPDVRQRPVNLKYHLTFHSPMKTLTHTKIDTDRHRQTHNEHTNRHRQTQTDTHMNTQTDTDRLTFEHTEKTIRLSFRQYKSDLIQTHKSQKQTHTNTHQHTEAHTPSDQPRRC